MSTIAEAMDAATAELRATRVAVEALRQLGADQLAQTVNSAQTIVNNYINRSPSASVFVDFNNGVDAIGRGGVDTPYKTIDYAIERSDKSVANTFYLLSDMTLTKWHILLSAVGFVGISKIPSGPYGYPFTFTNRKLNFATEAYNSPRTDLGRLVPFLDSQQGGISFRNIDIAMPTPVAGVNWRSLIGPSSTVSFVNSTITAEAAGVDIKLINRPAGQAIVSFEASTFTANAAGKIFTGVAAGADPNGLFNYRSNITSA